LGRPSFEEFYDLTTMIYRFAYGLDTGNWELMRTLFADRVEIDTSATGQGVEKSWIAADEFVWRVKLSETGFDGTQLLLGNPIVDVDGDTAEVTVCFYGEHVAAITSGDPWYTIGGYQTWRLARTDGRWLVDGFTLSPLWTRGNRDVMKVGVRRGEQRLAERGDPPPAGMVEQLENW